MARLDRSVPRSVVGSRFALEQSLPSRMVPGDSGSMQRILTGPVFVSTPHGEYHATFEMSVGYVPVGDVILGADWFAGTRAQMCDDGLLDASPTCEFDTGFGWRTSSDQTTAEVWVPLGAVARDAHATLSSGMCVSCNLDFY